MRTYIVENGDIFLGTNEHWQDCFFDNAEHENIVEFCQKMKWKLEWTDEPANHVAITNKLIDVPEKGM